MAVDVETAPPIPSWQRGGVVELARHGRPQADRDPLPRTRRALLRRRRDHGAADPNAARPGERALHRARLLQPALHDPRDDDDLPRRRADPRRLRQLPRPADDRRAGHGLPAPERALLLALPLRRRHPAALVLRPGRRGPGRLDELPAELRPRSRATARTSGSSRCTCSRSRRSPARSTSSSRSTTCARRG